MDFAIHSFKPTGVGLYALSGHKPLKATRANALRTMPLHTPTVRAQAGMQKILNSRGILHHRLSNVVFELDKEGIRPVAFPGGSLKQIGKIPKKDGAYQMLLEITGEGPFYFSLPGRQIGPDAAGKAVAFIVPFDRLDLKGKTEGLNIIM
jgi:hypothetical protein